MNKPIFVKACIEDNYDDAMMSFYHSEKRQRLEQAYNHLFRALENDLSPELGKRLGKVTEALIALYAEETAEAYYRGVVDGSHMKYDVE